MLVGDVRPSPASMNGTSSKIGKAEQSENSGGLKPLRDLSDAPKRRMSFPVCLLMRTRKAFRQFRPYNTVIQLRGPRRGMVGDCLRVFQEPIVLQVGSDPRHPERMVLDPGLDARRRPALDRPVGVLLPERLRPAGFHTWWCGTAGRPARRRCRQRQCTRPAVFRTCDGRLPRARCRPSRAAAPSRVVPA
jgi:hypothetical protein